MTAHQRLIREVQELADPRPAPTSLTGYSVAAISRAAALPIILTYEWLGNIGQATTFVGLVSPDGNLHGVACFGNGPTGPIRNLIGSPALCLERGACTHYAPRNAASFLINRACKLIHQLTGTAIFFAYCDPEAGEYGGVYQAAGWAYLGQGLGGDGRIREQRTYVLQPGRDPNVQTNWQTTRILRRQHPPLTYATARALGWTIQNRAAKHVYCQHVGQDRQQWRESLRQLPYPAPDPLLKRG